MAVFFCPEKFSHLPATMRYISVHLWNFISPCDCVRQMADFPMRFFTNSWSSKDDLGVGFLALLSHNPAILVLPDMDGWKIMKKRHLNIFNVKDTPLMLNKELENHPMEKGASFWFHPHFQVQPLRTIVDSNQCGLLPFHLGGSSFSDTSLQSLSAVLPSEACGSNDASCRSWPSEFVSMNKFRSDFFRDFDTAKIDWQMQKPHWTCFGVTYFFLNFHMCPTHGRPPSLCAWWWCLPGGCGWDSVGYI